jgi:hypothetical protein
VAYAAPPEKQAAAIPVANGGKPAPVGK